MNARWIRRVWEREGLSGVIGSILLLPFSWLYLAAIHIRNFLYRVKWMRPVTLERPVISIGNLTVGGTGKTPSCLWLSRELVKRGLKVAILSRGYKKNGAAHIVLTPGNGASSVSECDNDAAAAGDEPFMMARLHGQTVGVGKERYKLAQEVLLEHDVDVFILDDGFQHRQLNRDVDLLLLGSDCAGRVLPSGPFREPIKALRRADFFLLTGAQSDWKALIESKRNGACFTASVQPVSLVGYESNAWKEHPLTLLYRSRILAVTGIAKPDGFYSLLRECEGEIVDILEFPDHHVYSSSDWQQINRAGRGVDFIVTTEKDIIKLVRFPFAKDKLLALRVVMNVENGELLVDAMLDRIEKNNHRLKSALPDRSEGDPG
jgi:tetraacyldisaccharide 4'-kinase